MKIVIKQLKAATKVSMSAVVSAKLVDEAKKFLADAGVKCILDAKGSGCIVFKLTEPAIAVATKLKKIYGSPAVYKTKVSLGWTWDLATHGVIDIVVLKNTAVGKVRFLTFWKADPTQTAAEE